MLGCGPVVRGRCAATEVASNHQVGSGPRAARSRVGARSASMAGCTPVTKESGKHHAVHFRWACNKRFRNAITTFADNSRHASPWAADIYRRAIERGCDHPHAVRILARAWIRVIWRCWMDRVPYDPAKHGAVGRVVGSASLAETNPA